MTSKDAAPKGPLAAPAVASLIALAVHAVISGPAGLLAVPYGAVAVAIAWPTARSLWRVLTRRRRPRASGTTLLVAHGIALLIAAALSPVAVSSGLALFRLLSEGTASGWTVWGGAEGLIPVVVAYALVSLSAAANLRRRLAESSV